MDMVGTLDVKDCFPSTTEAADTPVLVEAGIVNEAIVRFRGSQIRPLLFIQLTEFTSNEFAQRCYQGACRLAQNK